MELPGPRGDRNLGLPLVAMQYGSLAAFMFTPGR